MSSLPWLCGGDFNEILSLAENKGGSSRSTSALVNFRCGLSDVGLSDLGFSSYPFTWLNERDNSAFIQESLDCFVSNDDWRFLFPSATVEHGIAKLRKRINRLYKLETLSVMLPENQNLEKKLEDLLNKEEVYWRQRSKVEWLKSGDQNTSYFHKKASNRRKKNQIRRLKDSNGEWKEDKEDLFQISEGYFSSIFCSSLSDGEAMSLVLNATQSRISSKMMEFLDSPFTVEDVRVALFQMSN
ncbi:Endonuclease/exonuclease/phosphatase [Parasponia andersonii]|uniref:Endonuclease/exonuclease/phosphatase n=1 Tax=Parasponia andersonii TaxID=3476 RepID=A0A2P5CQS5_PARAD|nr:Endonuclease/exonuclease/phosphatase [Parasponia andersonii]